MKFSLSWLKTHLHTEASIETLSDALTALGLEVESIDHPGEALRDINYQGAVVMEPFVKMGGKVGSDIKVWRDLSQGADEAKMDQDAKDALIFSRYMLG